VLRAGQRAVGFVDPQGVASDPPARAIAFCGIAGPERFQAALLDLGIEVVELRPYRDHHRYSAREIEDLTRRALEHGCDLVTTEKDLARIGSAGAASVRARLLALRIEAVVHDPRALDEAIERALGAGGCDTMPRRA
jgi:tetraacyldisaccharide 4'-kinase